MIYFFKVGGQREKRTKQVPSSGGGHSDLDLFFCQPVEMDHELLRSWSVCDQTDNKVCCRCKSLSLQGIPSCSMMFLIRSWPKYASLLIYSEMSNGSLQENVAESKVQSDVWRSWCEKHSSHTHTEKKTKHKTVKRMCFVTVHRLFPSIQIFRQRAHICDKSWQIKDK